MTTEPTTRLTGPRPATPSGEPTYEHEETRTLVTLVDDAAELLRARGEDALDEFRRAGTHWRRGDSYVFVLDRDGTMLVHPDPGLEGRTLLDLVDVTGRPIIRGLIDAAPGHPGRSDGWYHYQWPVPGELFPRWKSSYVRLVELPKGARLIVGSGMYNDRMERAFVVDAVTRAVAEIEEKGEAAFPLLRDPRGPFIAKDSYVFVTDLAAVGLVNPAFPTLEGRDLLDLRDTEGKYVNREMLELIRTRGSGWIEYLWPRPGESVATRKSAFVSRARCGDRTVMVGCGVYLEDAPRAPAPTNMTTGAQLARLVRAAAALLEMEGEKAYAAFREKGSRWYGDHSYLFAFDADGRRAFHAAEPESEGRDDSDLRDAEGRPIVRMILAAAASPAGEGWVHYLYPRPGELFPVWKSSFVRGVTYPDGGRYVVGSGLYGMQMEQSFIEDLVDRAADLVADRGPEAFPLLRDRAGPFVFMDTYVFVQTPDGIELVNPATPNLEGRNLMDLVDVTGTSVVREEIEATMREGRTWYDCFWYRPGTNIPTRKRTFLRRVVWQDQTFIVGSGIYED
jgi:signal transduction histidine kinase